MKKESYLNEYLRSLVGKGDYFFTKEKALEDLKVPSQAFNIAAHRAFHKGRLIHINHGFYVIVSDQFSSFGSPPPSYYLDSYMKHINAPYYVCLLTAAMYYGAAHQQPQVFQVISNKRLSSFVVGRSRVSFFYKKNMEKSVFRELKTPTGIIKVASPEQIMLDLPRYIHGAGFWNTAATVIHELSSQIDESILSKAAENLEIAHLQRLGYVLEYLGHANLAEIIEAVLANRKKTLVLFTPSLTKQGEHNKRWNLIVNDYFEIDE